MRGQNRLPSSFIRKLNEERTVSLPDKMPSAVSSLMGIREARKRFEVVYDEVIGLEGRQELDDELLPPLERVVRYVDTGPTR